MSAPVPRPWRAPALRACATNAGPLRGLVHVADHVNVYAHVAVSSTMAFGSTRRSPPAGAVVIVMVDGDGFVQRL